MNEGARASSGGPARGEVWPVRLPRAVGAELQRDRPVIVVHSPTFQAAPVRIVVPLPRWRGDYADSINKVDVPAGERNGLHVDSVADFLQIRSVSLERFIERLGEVGAELVEEIVSGVAIAIADGPS